MILIADIRFDPVVEIKFRSAAPCMRPFRENRVDTETMTQQGNPKETLAATIDNLERVKELPKEVGVLLLAAGVGGVLLPGPIGSPFLIMAGVVLWPRLFLRVEVAFERRFPGLHRQGVRQIKRFLSDLESRYPSKAC